MFSVPEGPWGEPSGWESYPSVSPRLGANSRLRAPSAASSGFCLHGEESWGQGKGKAAGLGSEPGALPDQEPPTGDLSRTCSPSASELTVGAGRDPLTDQVTSRAQFLSKTLVGVARRGSLRER